MDHFGDGKLPAPIACGPWFVLWPELSVFVGVLQIFFGAYVIVRSTVQTASPGTDEGLGLFQAVGWFVMIASVMCQSVGQVSLHAVNAPGVFVVNIIGFSLWPMYLDGEGQRESSERWKMGADCCSFRVICTDPNPNLSTLSAFGCM
ncbi:unnamed protein product [Discosporangium mesarthrocarpum]